MLLLLVCILLTLDLTLANYVNNLINLIIRPAGRSRSFKWLGRGSAASAPLYIPRPIFIPRWIPQHNPQYTAKWVPTLPPAHSSSNSAVGASHPHGFGAPKANSVIKGGSIYDKMVAPPPPKYMNSEASHPIAAIDIHPRRPVYKVPVDTSGFESPHEEDIITAAQEQMKIEPSNSIADIDIRNNIPENKVPADTSGYELPHEDDILTTPLLDTENETKEFVTDLTTVLSLKEDPISTTIPIFNVDVRNNAVDDLITDQSVAESITVLSIPDERNELVQVTSAADNEFQSSDTRRLFQVSQSDQFAEIKSYSPIISAQPRLNNDVVFSSQAKSSPVQRLVPKGRAIPYPVSFPIGPLGSVTLDFPDPSEFSALQAGVRSSKAFESPYIPYGARLQPVSRSYTKKAYYG